jgi:rfaE bifunctional protein nucleotidyltransferase chain/domain
MIYLIKILKKDMQKLLSKKIINKDDFYNTLQEIKKNNNKIVLCHGVFDLLHFGHINYFREAKKLGDTVIVSLTSDKFVLKGPGRPHFNFKNRAKVISELSSVDYVIESDAETAEDIIKFIKPNIYFKGADYKNKNSDISMNIGREIKIVKKYKGTIKYSDEESFSSSSILNDELVGEQKIIVDYIKKNYDENFFIKLFSRLKKIRILVIGEAIIDKYLMVNVLGKSGKEPILNFEEVGEKPFLGGVLAIANNISNFVKNVKIISFLGSTNSQLNFIKKRLNKNVNFDFLFKKNYPTMMKTKIVEKNHHHKFFGLYNFSDNNFSKNEKKILKQKILKSLKKFDLITVSDYGHNFIEEGLSNILKKEKKLIVNTQINAANIGYHTISKYKGVNCAIINEVELRHELKNKYSDIKVLLPKLSKKLKINYLIVTVGKNGSYGYDLKNNDIYYCPAFAKDVTDKLGAGDAYLSIFSAIYSLGIKDLKLLMFISSLGTLDVIKSLGNSNSVSFKSLIKSIIYLIK